MGHSKSRKTGKTHNEVITHTRTHFKICTPISYKIHLIKTLLSWRFDTISTFKWDELYVWWHCLFGKVWYPSDLPELELEENPSKSWYMIQLFDFLRESPTVISRWQKLHPRPSQSHHRRLDDLCWACIFSNLPSNTWVHPDQPSWTFSSLNITFLHSDFQLMWFFTQSTRSAKWRSVIQGTALIFLYRRYSAACRTCWTRLTLIFNSMDLFNFDALVIWLDAARNNLLLAILGNFSSYSTFFLR